MERDRERDLHHGDLPFQGGELFAGAARAKHERAFARVQRISFGVHDVIDAVKQKPKWEKHEKQSQPEFAGMQEIRMPEGHKVKQGRGAPQPGARNLQQEDWIGLRRMTAGDTGRGMGGFGHLAQYTAVLAAPGLSKVRDVPNRFARFKFFANKV